MSIDRFLSGLVPTGETGFEGLVADLCEAATGQRFILSGAGSQEGQDSRSESGYGNRIKVEAKHYMKSALNLRELTAEIVQATSSGSAVDLWILAASCAATDQHVTALEEIAKRQHIEVLFLDLGNDGLPRLTVLMAAFPQRVEDWAGRNAASFPVSEIRAALEDVRANDTFASARDALLQRLRGTVLGYDDARHRTKQRFLSAMRDQGNAVSHFNQRAAVRSDEVRSIRRVSIHDQISSWWSSSVPGQKRAVLIGEEGTGKTWVALDWMADRIEAGTMPIVLPFSGVAESIADGETIEDLLPRLLLKWTGVGDVTFWKGRLNRWFESPGRSTPLILLLADGLNERPAVPWPSFFRTLEEDRWRKHVAILATDRAGHWVPNCARAGLDGFQEVRIDGYTDWELEQILQGRGIGIESIPIDLGPLIRKPRYCELVCQHFAEMKDNSDFTIERLILLDARYRSDLKRGAMTEAEFIEVLRNLASYYRTSPTVRLSDIKDLAPFADPARLIHQEIIDSGLLVPRPGIGTGFTIERMRLVFGLGMLLCDEMRRSVELGADSSSLENELTSWFEPHPEMDLKVETCGAALFHSLIDEGYPSIARREMLRYWLALRNWGDNVQDAFTDYVRRCPQDFIAIAEEFWTSERNLGAAQDFLRAAFTKFREDPGVQPCLIDAISRWLSFVHPAGHPLLRHDVAREEKQRTQIAARVGHPLAAGPLRICGAGLTVIEDDARLRLSRFGFLLISVGSVLPFVESLVRWAVASAVMGQPMEAEVVRWVVRFTEEPIDDALFGAAQRLLTRKEPLAHEAAYTLLSLSGTSKARKLRNQYPRPESEDWKQFRALHAADPCLSGLEWSEDDCLLCVKRDDVPINIIVSRLRDRLFDPEFPFPESLVQRARTVLAIDPGKYRVSLWQTAEAHWLNQALPLLASCAPRDVADFMRSVVATIPARRPDDLYPVAIWLPEVSLLFAAVEQGLVEQAISVLTDRILQSPVQSGNSPNGINWRAAEGLAFLATLPQLTAEGVFAALLKRPADAYDLERFEPWFRILPPDDRQAALDLLRSPTDDVTAVRILWFLSLNKIPLSAPERDLIYMLSQSRNSQVRGAAMRFTFSQEDAELARRIVDDGRSFRENRDAYEARWGTRLLIRFSGQIPFETLAERLHPADLGYALHHRGRHPEEVRIYVQALDQCLWKLLDAPDPDIPNLPQMVAAPGEGEFGDYRPKLTAEPDPAVVMKNASLTWTAGKPSVPLQMSIDARQVADDLAQRAQQRANAISAAWQTPAFNWFGTSFSSSAMNAVCNECPEIAKRWAGAALRADRIGQTMRVRLATFLAALCPALLEHVPTVGLALWKKLHEQMSGLARVSTISCAFAADDCSAANEARSQLLESCHNDAAIGEVAYIAEINKRQAWLGEAIQRLISKKPLYKKALGLTLASFSDITPDRFRGYILEADVEETWVGDQTEWMQWNVKRNSFAKHWFQVFLNAEDKDASWGALQVMLRCADHRFYIWHRQYVPQAPERVHQRMRFLNANGHDIETTLDHQKQREDTLFGIRIERGEVFPFLES
jgi:hypothetical protein